MEAGFWGKISEWFKQIFRGRQYSLENYAEKHKGLDDAGKIRDDWLEDTKKTLSEKKERNLEEDFVLRKIEMEQARRIMEQYYPYAK